jgi:hypothetical protein
VSYADRTAKILHRDLLTTARAIRRSRPLSDQKAIARGGRSPATGNWYPSWIPWERMTDPVRAIMTRYTSTTGRAAGRKTSPAKKASSPVNGRLGARHGIKGARYGALGPAARARKARER